MLYCAQIALRSKGKVAYHPADIAQGEHAAQDPFFVANFRIPAQCLCEKPERFPVMRFLPQFFRIAEGTIYILHSATSLNCLMTVS